MPKTSEELVSCFREDHVRMGRAFHDLGACLRAGDADGARDLAGRIDRDAGAHIAFEERELYPLLADCVEGLDVEGLYGEHGEGKAVLLSLQSLTSGAPLAGEAGAGFLAQTERVQSHIAECSRLFEAVLTLPESKQADLLESLLDWRRRAPRWTSLGARDPDS